ncbi:MAG: hypothetical protein ACERKD_15575 [Prolixibacteraceae bacterium]
MEGKFQSIKKRKQIFLQTKNGANRGNGKTKVNLYKLKKGTYIISIQDKDGAAAHSLQFIKKLS